MILVPLMDVGVLGKHLEEYHGGVYGNQYALFKMKSVRGLRTVLDRLVQEGTNISNTECRYPNWIMNSRSEWGKGKMVRFEPTVTRI